MKEKNGMKTIIEPFRNKMVEPITFTTREERATILNDAGYNLFQVRAEHVIVDLLTDSGTTAMSSEQWSAMMRGDESYAGCTSFFRFREKVQDIFGFPEVIPVHQGRAAERLFFARVLQPQQIVPSNAHFDTTRANIENFRAQAVDCPHADAANASSLYPFKGNIDLDAVKDLFDTHGRERIPFGMLTITNNAAAGQPVSLENIRSYSCILEEYGVPLYIDGARFAENAFMIHEREDGCATSIKEIVRDIFSCAQGTLVSAKKDGLVNMGGFIALRDRALAESLRQDLIMTEGFTTYGGLAGRDLEAMAVGLEEVLSEDYLRYRQKSAEYLARGLRKHGIPVVMPAGMHAIYIDATQMLDRIPDGNFPGQSLVCALYLEAGIRSCEIGSVMFGSARGIEQNRANKPDMVRLALPRRLYNQSHYDYVIEALGNIYQKREEIPGMRIVWEPPSLRHFTAMFAPVVGEKKKSLDRVVSETAKMERTQASVG